MINLDNHKTITHHTRSWIRYPAFVSPPLVVGALFMSEGTIEGFSDVSHAVNTHSKTLEHITVERAEIYSLT